MLKNYFLRAFILCFSTVLLFSCVSTPENEDDTNPDIESSDRGVMLASMADEIIIPSYANFKIKLDDLVTKTNSFNTTPNASNLNELRTAWVDAYKEWQKVELFDFGPASSKAIRFYFNIYPANTTQIENNITSGSYNIEVPANYASQGFPALDYLLYGLGDDDETIAKYTTDANASKRLNYLTMLVNRMSTLFNSVNEEWTTGGYRKTFISKTSLDMNGSTSLIVNAYVLNYERYIRSAKIGIPAGVMTAGVTYPDKVEAYYKKDISKDLAKIANQASYDFFIGKSVKSGKEVSSLKTYLNSIGARETNSKDSLTKIVIAKFNESNTKLDLLGNNFSSEVNNNNPAMVDAYDVMQTIVRLLKLDMTSAMSITITYTDNDGD